MTVQTTTYRADYTGNGVTTAFTVPFYFLDNTHVKVLRTQISTGTVTTLALTTDYTMTGAGSGSGGTLTALVAPTSDQKISILRNVPLTQLVHYVPNDPFPAATHEQALDQLTMEIQQLQEAISRSIKISSNNTITTPEMNYSASARAGLVIGFDTNGDITVSQAIGNYRGNWSASTAYVQRDIIKDTSNANIYLCLTAHTSSGSQPISTNTDGAKWALLVDAATATTAATNAAASASAASTSATNASTSATNAASSASSASTSASTATTQASNASSSASSASTSATNAASSATSASASATAAAAAAASGLYRQVLDKSANYTIVAADQGTLFRANTGSGALTFTLPTISTVTDGFKVSIVKWTNDANLVSVTRAGSDTINGAASVQIANQYSQIVFVADFETNTWFASQSGLGATNKNVDRFSGNGSTTAFTLSADPSTYLNTDVYIAGAHQDHSTYSTSGTTLTFSTAPPAGTSNIEVVYGTPLAIGTPSDGTVTTAKIADASITAAKMANGGAEFGVVNRIINGAMMVNQLGSVTTSGGYTLDQWIVNTQGAAVTVTQGAAAYPGAVLANCLAVQGAAGVTAVGWNQRIEAVNSRDLAGGSITVSYWTYQDTGATQTHTVAIYRANSTDNFGASTIEASSTASIPSGVWTQVVKTFSLSTSATTGIALDIAGVGAIVAGKTAQLAAVDLRKGTYASAPPADWRSYGAELALCQRYIPVWDGTGNQSLGPTGQCGNSTIAVFNLQTKVKTRVPATGITTTGSFLVTNSGFGGIATTVTFNHSTTQQIQVVGTVASGIVAGNAVNLLANGPVQIIGTGCTL